VKSLRLAPSVDLCFVNHESSRIMVWGTDSNVIRVINFIVP